MAQGGYGTADVIAPRAIILPEVNVDGLSGANYSIGMSGATLVFWNGTAWKEVTTA